MRERDVPGWVVCRHGKPPHAARRGAGGARHALTEQALGRRQRLTETGSDVRREVRREVNEVK